jgi:hypothetical protein
LVVQPARRDAGQATAESVKFLDSDGRRAQFQLDFTAHTTTMGHAERVSRFGRRDRMDGETIQSAESFGGYERTFEIREAPAAFSQVALLLFLLPGPDANKDFS